MSKLVLALLAVLLLLTACTSEPQVNMANISEAFEANGVKLMEEDATTNHFILNGLKAASYKLDDGESVSIYLYRSVKERKRALADFNKQKAQYDMVVPIVYEVKNALIFYWYQGETGSQTKYGDAIDKAVAQLQAISAEYA